MARPKKQTDGKIEHIYQNIEGWFSFQKFYSDIIAELKTGSRIVEVGTYKGCSFSYLVIEALNSGKKFDIWGVDACPWEDVERDFNKNMESLKGNFQTKFGGDSFVRAAEFEDESIDFVFIDAGHLTHEVLADMDAWYPKVKSNGIFAGHDYFPGSWDSVVTAVHQWMGDRKFAVSEGCWIYQKP